MNAIRRMGIAQGLREYGEKQDSALIDVRSPEEYAGGNIAGSVNIPLMDIPYADEEMPGPDTTVYVYCASGRRSCQAAAVLEQMGYTDIVDLGGAEDYIAENS